MKKVIGAFITGVLFAALIVVGISVYYYTFRRTYHDYRIIYSRTQEDTVSTRYVPLGKNILRYNQDGVSLIDNSLETKWSEAYLSGVRNRYFR